MTTRPCQVVGGCQAEYIRIPWAAGTLVATLDRPTEAQRPTSSTAS
ncbi:hypothetical protein ACFRAR_22450 [Kitasatospora sp. NPDC056651]